MLKISYPIELDRESYPVGGDALPKYERGDQISGRVTTK